MDHSKKMAILPQSLVASFMNQQLLGNQGVAYLGELDGQMKSIMDNKNLPSDIKAKQYGHILNRFLQMRGNELKEASGIQFAEPQPPTQHTSHTSTASVGNETDLLGTVAGRNKNKAKILLEHVRNNPDLGWNARNQLVYKGQPVPNSNLPDLLNQYSRSGNRNEVGFVGWREFGKALNEHNTPRTAVGNRRLLERAAQSEEEEEEEIFQSPTGAGPSSSLSNTPDTAVAGHSRSSNSTPPLNSSGEGTSQQRQRSRVFTRSQNPAASTPKARNQWTTWR